MRRRVYIFFAVVVVLSGLLAATAQVPSPVRAAVPGERITTRATPTKMRLGQRTVVSGVLSGASGPVPGEMLELQIDPVPYGQFLNVAHALTKAGGRYRFPAVRIDRDTHLRVLDVGANGPIGPTVTVTVQPPAYPASERVIAAAHYLAGRAGVTAFAVVDDEGRLAGANLHMRFHSASVVKSMLLVAYLRMLAQQHRSLDGASQALLYPMIHSSDNGAATAVLAAVGEDALDRVARVAHMRDYEPAGATWGFTEVSAADLARFFFHQDSLIPRQFDGYARWLLSTIEPSESWGIPAVARPEFRVFFKGGWLPEVEGLVNQVGRLERPGVVFSLSVLTTHDPSMEYGEGTIEGVTARLLGRAG